LFDARAAGEAAPRVAALLAQELGRDADWEREQVEVFSGIVAKHLPSEG
jgi:glycerol-3-phosphate dehydrogenase